VSPAWRLSLLPRVASGAEKIDISTEEDVP